MECEFPAFPGCPELGSKVQLAVPQSILFSLLGWLSGLSTHLTRNSLQTTGHSSLPLSPLGAGGSAMLGKTDPYFWSEEQCT